MGRIYDSNGKEIDIAELTDRSIMIKPELVDGKPFITIYYQDEVISVYAPISVTKTSGDMAEFCRNVITKTTGKTFDW